MITNSAANFRISVPFPIRHTNKAIRILDKHVGLSFGQRIEMTKTKDPYTLPHDYTLEYATAIAKEFDAAGVPVRITSSIDGDVTGDVIGRRDMPANPRPVPSKVAKVAAGFLIAAVVVILLVIAVSLGDTAAKPPSASKETNQVEKTEEPTQVTASKLFASYQRNEVLADEAYKGKPLLVTGTVESINKDFKDDIYVILATSNMFMGVHANLANHETNSAAGLNKGDRITVLCTGDGMIVGSPMLSDCHLQ